METKFRAVRGKLPRKRDVVDWGDNKLLQFLKLIDYFTQEGKFKCTKETVETAYMRMVDEPFWQEFLVRIDKPPEKYTPRQFYYRFLAFARVPLSWIKANPHTITPEMAEIISVNPRMEWVRSSFEIKKTETGIEVIEMKQDETTDPGIKNVVPSISNVPQPEVIFNQAMLKMSGVFRDLLSDIKVKDIKKMNVEKRIKLAISMSASLSKSFSQYKPNIAIFQKININKTGREDLESTILTFSNNEQN